MQRRHLGVLGIDVLRLRLAPDSSSPATGVRLSLRRYDGRAADLAHPRVRAILRVLELEPQHVAATAASGVPELALPDPDELASPRVKRELWPALRRLRRVLRECTKPT